MTRILLAIALLFAAIPARAQTPQMPYAYPVTVGTSQVAVMALNPSRRRIMFVNPNPVAIIAVCPSISRANSAAINCTVNGAGSITLLPYASQVLDGVGGNPLVPSAWNAISNTASSALTVFEWE